MSDDPTQMLLEPSEMPDDIEHGNLDLNIVVHTLNLSYQINALCRQLLGYAPLTAAADLFVGDWKKFGECSQALVSLGDFSTAVSANVWNGMSQMAHGWRGNAADQAKRYFGELSAALSVQAEALRELGRVYKGISFGVHMVAIQVEALLAAALDRLLIAAISAAVGTALAETGVGAVVGYGIAAWQIVSILELLAKASMVIEAGITAAEGVIPEVINLGHQLQSVREVPLPAEGYVFAGAYVKAGA